MIQLIILSLVAVWLAWGVFNVLYGVVQILSGVACGIISPVLYLLAYGIEFIFGIIQMISSFGNPKR